MNVDLPVPTDLNTLLPYLLGAVVLYLVQRFLPGLKLPGLPDAPAKPAAPTPAAPVTPAMPVAPAPVPPALLQRPAVVALLNALTMAAAVSPNRIDDLALALLRHLTQEQGPPDVK